MKQQDNLKPPMMQMTTKHNKSMPTPEMQHATEPITKVVNIQAPRQVITDAACDSDNHEGIKESSPGQKPAEAGTMKKIAPCSNDAGQRRWPHQAVIHTAVTPKRKNIVTDTQGNSTFVMVSKDMQF